MTEFAASLLLCISLLAGAGSLFHHEWNRARCAYLTFEATHARLVGRLGRGGSVSIIETGTTVRGEGVCGNAHEIVTLPKLEAEPW